MSAFSEAASRAVREVFCGITDAALAYRQFYVDLARIAVGEEPRPRRRACPNADPPPPCVPPYEGGQCSTLYTSQRIRNPGEALTNPFAGVDFVGPIVSASISPSSNTCGGGSVTQTITVTDQVTTRTTTNPIGCVGTETRQYTLRFVRKDGGAECGNPPCDPPPPIPPEGITQPISITYIDESGDEITEEGDVSFYAPIFAPIIGSFNTLYAPIRISLPDINFDGTLDLGPEFNVNLAPSVRPRGIGEIIGDILPIDPFDDGPPIPPQQDRKLIGVHVRCFPTDASRATMLQQIDGPTLYVPRLANVYFRVRNDNVEGWDGPYDVKVRAAYIPVPENSNAIAVTVSGEGGVGVDWEPVFIDPRVDAD